MSYGGDPLSIPDGGTGATTASGARTALGLGTIATQNTPLGPTVGGTNQTTYATGDTLYASAANTLSKRTIGATGTVLTVSGGVPTWGTAPIYTVTGQQFTTPGAFTYTPTSGMKFVIVELIGAGGGSGGCAISTGAVAVTGGGGSGSYARFILTAAQVGASLAGSVGALGAAGAAGNNAGSAGGNTTLATTAAWTVNGGGGSAGSAAAASVAGAGGGAPVLTTGTGTILATSFGQSGSHGVGVAATFALGGIGGSGTYGRGGRSTTIVTSTAIVGGTAFGRGAGGGGSVSLDNGSAVAGAAGTDGIAIFTEFL